VDPHATPGKKNGLDPVDFDENFDGGEEIIFEDSGGINLELHLETIS